MKDLASAAGAHALDNAATFQVVPFDAPLGAEVIGLDLRQPVSEAALERLRVAYARHAVLVIRDQHLTPEQHIRFSKGFGALAVHMMEKYLLPGYPEIFRVSNIVENGQRIGGSGEFWHTDLSYVADPSRGRVASRR